VLIYHIDYEHSKTQSMLQR